MDFGVQLVPVTSFVNQKNYSAVIVGDHFQDRALLKQFRELTCPKYLIAEEVPFLLPDNYAPERTREYNLVFTWREDLVDDKKYIYNFSLFPDTQMARIIRESDFPISMKAKKVYVGSAKKDIAANSLYGFRRDLIEWFNKHKPSEIDLYGAKWDRYYFRGSSLGAKFLNWRRIDMFFNGLNKNTQRIYKGKIKSKYFELKKYRFQFCLENGFGYPGYVTEKLFDAMICRNVPVYKPTDDVSVSKIVPKDVFINMNDFESFEDLNSHLNSLSDDDVAAYLMAAEKFLEHLPEFLRPDYASGRVAQRIIRDLAGGVEIKGA